LAANTTAVVAETSSLSESHPYVDDLPSGSSPAKSRKRGRDHDKWKSVVKKRARQNGVAYISNDAVMKNSLILSCSVFTIF